MTSPTPGTEPDQTTGQSLELYVANLDCEHDAAAIERGLSGAAGISKLTVYPKAAKVALTFDPTVTSAGAVREHLQRIGFPPHQGRALAPAPKLWRNPKVITSALSGLLLLVGWLGSRAGVPHPVSLALYYAAIASGGYYFGREALETLLFQRRIGIDLLMATAALVAILMGEALEGAMLVFLYSISEAAEGYTEEKTRSAVKALMDLTPKVALVRRAGRELELPVEKLTAGEVFIVKPGQSIATDGVVVEGSSSVDQAPVTGESVPVEKRPDDGVFAGSLNGEGVLVVRATKGFADNTIARIIHLVEEAQEQKGKSQRFIERFSTRYSPAVLAIGLLVALLPPLFGADWSTWLTRATVFIVAAAPCALVISIPITLVATLGTGARKGVLIKGGVYVEELATIQVVALDKTGTVTSGQPEVTDVVTWQENAADQIAAREQLLAVAAGIERHSQHPLAKAVVRYATTQGVLPAEVQEVRSLTGAGATARYQDTNVYIGGPALFAGQLGSRQERIGRLQTEGKTVVVVGDAHHAWGVLALRDTVRPNAWQAIAALHAAGIQQVVMLTGDNERAARAIAAEVGIDDVAADLKPEEKAAAVRRLAAQYGQVAMVGDGVNDAPALAAATIGVAMGAAGTDVALETADVALMGDDLEKLVYALRLAQRNRSVVRQNLVLSALVVGTLVIGAVAGLFSLPVAVLAHELSEFVVIGSGLRMLRG